jgi:hypothetical protein
MHITSRCSLTVLVFEFHRLKLHIWC